MRKCSSGITKKDGNVIRLVDPEESSPTFFDEHWRGSRVMQEMAAAKHLATHKKAEKRKKLRKIRHPSFLKSVDGSIAGNNWPIRASVGMDMEIALSPRIQLRRVMSHW